MLIVYKPAPSPSAEELRGKEEDTLALTWEQRRWVRGKFATTQGREIALALPTGTPLAPGIVILVETDWYLRVVAVAEPLLAVTPCDHRESIKLAFEIGNRHFPLALDGETILVPDDPAMAQLFNRLNVLWQRRHAIFSPIGNALAHTSTSNDPSGQSTRASRQDAASESVAQQAPAAVSSNCILPTSSLRPTPFLRVLQFSDGLFPAGGYAHSFGLETLVQSGRVQSADDVASFLRAHLENSAAPTDAVAALCAHNYALAHDLDSCLRLDRMLDALKPAAELRQASRQLGRQTLRVLNELSTSHLANASRQGTALAVPKACGNSGVLASEVLAPDDRTANNVGGSDPFVARFVAAADSDAALCHHPLVFGIAAAVFAWPPRETASAFLYSTSAMIVGASLRLLPLGQLAGQRILWSAGTFIAALSETVLAKHEDDIWSFTPELEIAAMRHESLDARLFRS